MAPHPLTLAMTVGARIPAKDRPFIRCHHEIGQLHLPTGNVVACDPFCGYTPVAFMPTLNPGTYPVSLAISEFDGTDQRVALAILRITNRQPERWAMAKTSHQGPDYNIHAPHGVYHYSVDYACGSFMDLKTAEVLAELMHDGATDLSTASADCMNGWLDRINELMAPTYLPTWSWANVIIEAELGLNLIVFSSGMGDGGYVSYWGYDASGRPACLVTDFLGVAEEVN